MTLPAAVTAARKAEAKAVKAMRAERDKSMTMRQALKAQEAKLAAKAAVFAEAQADRHRVEETHEIVGESP